jgi:ankyrin repeat protein
VKWLRDYFTSLQSNSTIDYNNDSWRPLHWCALLTGYRNSCCNTTDLQILCREHKSNGSCQYAVSPLSMAVCKEQPNMDAIKILLEEYPNAATTSDADGAYPFMYACAWNEGIELVDFLHQLNPTSIQISDMYGFTALHYASYVGSYDVIKYIIDKNSNACQQTNNYGVLPLNACVINTRCGINAIKLIFKAYRSAISIFDDDGKIPLHKAVQSGTFETIQYIHRKYPEGAYVADNEGLLPLHLLPLRSDKSIEVQEYVLNMNPTGIINNNLNNSRTSKTNRDDKSNKDCKMM